MKAGFCLSGQWLLLLLCILFESFYAGIDVQNAVDVNNWWYHFEIYDFGLYPITNVRVRSYDETQYNPCKLEDWASFPWTCARSINNIPYKLPLTMEFTNSIGQTLVIMNLVTNLEDSSIFRSTFSFPIQPTISSAPTSSPSIAPTPATISPPINTPFLGSTLQSPHYVGYINKVQCDVNKTNNNDNTCLASIGLPGYFSPNSTRSHEYNVLNFGSYLITENKPLNGSAFAFWMEPNKYLNGSTIASITGSATSTNSEIRIALHNIYAEKNIKILLSTFGEEDDTQISDNWIENGLSPQTIGSTLATLVSDYYFDGVNINFNTYQSTYFDVNQTAEIALIILTESLNSALNRNSLNPYFIITHTVSSKYFDLRDGYLMVHEYCSKNIKWYNIKYYAQNSFLTMFLSNASAVDALLSGENKRNIQINATQIVISRACSPYNSLNGYIPSDMFAEILSVGIQRRSPQWNTGFMLYDFACDQKLDFWYSDTLIFAFNPTPQPTFPLSELTKAVYPTMPLGETKDEEDKGFDLLNLNSYEWGEWFFLLTMVIVLTMCCVGIGCAYHRYKVKDRILTDDQIKDIEDEMNKTMITDSTWRRLSKLLVRSDTIENEMNFQASIEYDDDDNVEMIKSPEPNMIGQSMIKLNHDSLKSDVQVVDEVDNTVL